MKSVKIPILLGVFIVLVAAVTLETTVNASGSKSTTATTSTKPADLVDSKDLAGQLLPEGKKIELTGKIHKGEGGRFWLTSSETQKAYSILENSILESMADTAEKNPGQVFKAVARVTVFRGSNYVFITRVELV